MKEKLKALFKRVKAIAAAASVAVVSAMTTVAASAATEEANNMESMLTTAGDEITSQFSSLVNTIIPVVIGILGTALVIFGIFALVKFAKKIFGKVAG